MCTGYGVLDLAAQAVYGGQLTWCAENDPYATVLLHRRFPGVPNLGDLTAIDWTQVPAVDIVTAGFPCQDISYAGPGAGIKKGTRSGLWLTIAEALRLLRPGLVLVENVAALRTRGLATVLGHLAALGYDTTWMCLRAADVGAPHRRDRMFIAAAHPAGSRDTWPDLPSAPQTARTPGQPVRCGMCRTTANANGLQRQRRRDRDVLAGTQSNGNNPAARCRSVLPYGSCRPHVPPTEPKAARTRTVPKAI
jgi:DNA (cytosine-5)-methyltransferase 1